MARTRVTIRLAKGNIVLANGLRGDPFESSGVYCEGWVLGTVSRGPRRFEGWVQTSALSRKPRRSVRGCRDSVKFRDRIAFVNAPFRSITWQRSKELKGVSGKGGWGTTGSASQSRLRRAGNAVAAARSTRDYVPGAAAGARLQDPVTPTLANRLFKRPELSRPTGLIGYRYTTPAGDAALVSVKTGFKKGPHGGKNVGLWGFVKRDCVVPGPQPRGEPTSSIRPRSASATRSGRHGRWRGSTSARSAATDSHHKPCEL